MVFDMNGNSVLGGLVAFPDWAFAGTPPTPPTQIRETVYIKGSASTTTSIGGSADNQKG